MTQRGTQHTQHGTGRRVRRHERTRAPRAMLDATISEQMFQAQVVALARVHGWLCYHTFDARRSEPGYPDLTLVRGGCVVYAELKSERGRLSVAQRRWIAALEVCMANSGVTPDGWPAVAVHVWRPSQWPEIERTLAGHARGAV